MSVFATDVSGGETCDTDVLNTDTGPVNLRAEFEPETINLRWYNGNTRLTVPNTSNTCIYDTAISLPANPTKPGYKFKGWKAVFDFSTLSISVGGTIGYANHQSANGQCRYYLPSEEAVYVDCNSDSVYADLNPYEWKAIFNYGIVYGKAVCWNGGGTHALPYNGDINESQNGNGYMCYCKVTGYIPTGSNIKMSSLHALPWVTLSAHSSAQSCLNTCASYCSLYAIRGDGRDSVFRNSLFGNVQ